MCYLILTQRQKAVNVNRLLIILFWSSICRYFVLLMLTDGIISDMAQTKEAIVTVSLV